METSYIKFKTGRSEEVNVCDTRAASDVRL